MAEGIASLPRRGSFATEPLVEVDGLQLSLHGTTILSEVGLTLGQGEILGLLGPNGAGKTTTIYAILGLLDPDAGTIHVFGREPAEAGAATRQRLGVLPEHFGFYDWMTAEGYLSFFATLYGRDPVEDDIARRLDLVGLRPRRGQKIESYSRGMRQRLALARALIGDPELLLLDEPTSGLDPRGRREIHDVLRHLADQGVGILLCTHLLDDVERLCSRIAVLVDGRTVSEGSIVELLRDRGRAGRYQLRLGGPTPEALPDPNNIRKVGVCDDGVIVDLGAHVEPAAAWRELLFRGWPIIEIAEEGNAIEDLYLSLTEGAR